MVADGMTALIGNAIWCAGRAHAATAGRARCSSRSTLPFVDEIGAVPIIGPIYRNLISGHDIVTYFAFALVPLTYWALYTHALRPAPARGRREPGGGRHGRHFGARLAL